MRDGINLALETLVLGITIFKTLGLKRMAARNGIKSSLGGMLLQDGKLPPTPHFVRQRTDFFAPGSIQFAYVFKLLGIFDPSLTLSSIVLFFSILDISMFKTLASITIKPVSHPKSS